MTHQECLGTLDAVAAGRPLPTSLRADVEAHLTACLDCWTVLERLSREATGAPPRSAARARELYGCEAVRDRFHALVGLRPAEMAAAHPAAAEHLGWCEACRLRFADLLGVEDAVARGALAESAVVGLVRAASVMLAIALRRGQAAFVDVPAWMVITPFAPAPARGESGDTAESLAQAVRVPAAAGGAAIELRVRAHDHERVDLDVVWPGADPGALVTLRSSDGAERLVASQTVPSRGPAVLSAVPAGRYLLDLSPAHAGTAVRLTLDVRTA